MATSNPNPNPNEVNAKLRLSFDIKNSICLEIGPSFAVRKHWRDTLKRLTEFLRLLDYIILELLRRLVKSAVRDLLIHLRESYSVEFDLANREQNDEDEDAQFHPSRQKSAASSLKSFRKQHRSESHTTYHTVRTTMNSEL